eukprot:TRINITY_DN31269_c0_g1_i1.p1 TRINITY_DN31269_c0_g1~~TRINITY_DN31269_c0_g1_i1.p1  ORF type:complete len:213 (+),score=72.34 TRINITY_DN31269_c0_g1_i1:37-639(+)
MLGGLRKRLGGDSNEADEEPMDIADQEALIRRFEEEHKRANLLFARTFSTVSALVVVVFGCCAYVGEMFHFGEATELASSIGSVCIALEAVVCAARLWQADAHDFDPSGRHTARARLRCTLPAGILGAVPAGYHLMLTGNEISRSYARTGDFYGALSPHHVIFAFPPMLLGITEYVAYCMQSGFCAIEELHGVKYQFKSA